MLKIAVVSKKGDQGKTTLLVHLAAAMARCGKRVLLSDLDGALGSSTQWLMGTDDLGRMLYSSIPDDEAITRLFRANPGKVDPSDVIYRIPDVANLAILPANPALEQLEGERQPPREIWPQALARIPQFLDAGGNVCGDDFFDVSFFDTGSRFGFLTAAAVTAADFAFSTCKPEEMSVDELLRIQPFLKEMGKYRQPHQPPLRWVGIVPSVIGTGKDDDKQLGIMQALFRIDPETGPCHVFKNHFKRRAIFRRAKSKGVPFCGSARVTKAEEMVLDIARELLQRCGSDMVLQPQPRKKKGVPA